MERVTWHILSSYKNLFHDDKYNSSDKEDENVLLESVIVGLLSYAIEKKLDIQAFYNLYEKKVANYIEITGEIDLEKLCLMAILLRGDFSKHAEKLGDFFRESSKILKLGDDVYKKYEMPSSASLIIIGRSTLLRFLSAKNKYNV